MFNTPVNFRRIATMIGILVLVFTVLEFNRRLEELNTLNRQTEAMRVQVTQSVQTQLALQTQVAYAGSTNAVEEWARIDGHYVQEGDLPVVPMGQPGAPPVEAATPTLVPTQIPNWEVWRDLFFGQ